MHVRKYLHSCLLLENNSKRLLIDPGMFSFIEGKLKPADIGRVDAILITHKHPDHFDAAVLKEFLSFGPVSIHTIREIGELLREAGLPNHELAAGDTQEIAGFSVKVFQAPHGPLPVPVPENVAFEIDGLLHPGDSFYPEGITSCETLALPIAGPWLNLNQALEMVERLKPKRVIPIHDAIIKDFMLQRMYELMLKPTLDARGVEFRPLKLNEVLEF